MKRQPGVAGVTDPFGSVPRVSADGRIAVATVTYQGSFADLPRTAFSSLESAGAPATAAGVDVQYGGPVVDIQNAAASDSADLIGIVVAVVILFLLFGSFLAAMLPIGIALLAAGVSSFALMLLASDLTIGSVAPVLGTMIGLGVGIDYSLFIVSRYRRTGTRAGRRRGHRPLARHRRLRRAVRRVLRGDGALRTRALRHPVRRHARLHGGAVRRGHGGRGAHPAARHARLRRSAHHPEAPHRREVRARPPASGTAWPTSWRGTRPLLAIALIVLRSWPRRSSTMRLGYTDDGNLPTSHDPAPGLRPDHEGFGPGANGPLLVAVALPRPGGADLRRDRRRREARRAIGKDARSARRCSPPIPSPAMNAAVVLVTPNPAPNGRATAARPRRCGDVIPAAIEGTALAGQVFVGGRPPRSSTSPTASPTGSATSSASRSCSLSFLLLMIVFRSILVPLKAAIMNLLSIAAAYGVIVAVFQWGWGKELIGLARARCRSTRSCR